MVPAHRWWQLPPGPGSSSRVVAAALTQAIAGAPDLVIVDEPTAGLDPEERHRGHRLLAELAEERTVVFSTHLVEDVAELCPRFAVLRGGRVLAATTPAAARAALAGTIFEGAVEATALPALARRGKWDRCEWCVLCSSKVVTECASMFLR